MDSSLVYLVQTDTSVGFSSRDDEKLAAIKKRPKSKKILQTITSFKLLSKKTRIPKKFRKLVRNSKKTTFIFPNNLSFRVISKKSSYYDFLFKFGTLYSTSANLSTKSYDKDFALKECDIAVLNKANYCSLYSSDIYKLSKATIKRIR